jgi:hypothetical protein
LLTAQYKWSVPVRPGFLSIIWPVCSCVLWPSSRHTVRTGAWRTNPKWQWFVTTLDSGLLWVINYLCLWPNVSRPVQRPWSSGSLAG